jgi:hypothetical protein
MGKSPVLYVLRGNFHLCGSDIFSDALCLRGGCSEGSLFPESMSDNHHAVLKITPLKL